MKLNKTYIALLFSIASYLQVQSSESKTIDQGKTKTQVAPEVKISKEEYNLIIGRLTEIRNMDLNKLTADKRTELRKEVKSINQRVRKDTGFFIYISGTAIIIILLLIILL